MTNRFAALESEREKLQSVCDNAKTQKERNRLGQFATPPALALEIVHIAKGFLPDHAKVRFLDPAFGTGAFFSALLQEFSSSRIQAATGFEIDRHYADATVSLWRGNKLDLRIADFTKTVPPKVTERYNLIVCNPPYVRHHHLTAQDKSRLRKLTRGFSGFSLSGLTGLYCYFLLLADAWLSDSGAGLWLIPSEFMDVNYGVPLKEYLLSKVTLLQVHRFAADDVQFADALVSSSVVCFRKCAPPEDHAVQFTFGGSLNKPSSLKMVPLSELRPASKWNGRGFGTSSHPPGIKLFDLFDIKRGLATGDNKFFILTREQIRENQLPSEFLRPILPSPRYLSDDEIHADVIGNPLLEHQRFLLDCRLPERDVRRDFPSLWNYLETGKNDVAKGYLCASRSPWYSQESRPAPLFLCTYMGRTNGKNGAAFRFILNHSKATAANVYLLLYPKAPLAEALRTKPDLARKVWDWLRTISPDVVLMEGRVYGGGLHKLEPRELGNVAADGIANLLDLSVTTKPIQLDFFANAVTGSLLPLR